MNSPALPLNLPHHPHPVVVPLCLRPKTAIWLFHEKATQSSLENVTHIISTTPEYEACRETRQVYPSADSFPDHSRHQNSSSLHSARHVPLLSMHTVNSTYNLESQGQIATHHFTHFHWVWAVPKYIGGRRNVPYRPWGKTNQGLSSGMHEHHALLSSIFLRWSSSLNTLRDVWL